MLTIAMIGGIVVIVAIVVLGIVIVTRDRQAGPAQPPLPSHEARIGIVEKFKCQECGAELDKDAVSDRQGFTFVSCSYCGSTYQLLEEPV